jgi:hypothetical protein
MSAYINSMLAYPHTFLSHPISTLLLSQICSTHFRSPPWQTTILMMGTCHPPTTPSRNTSNSPPKKVRKKQNKNLFLEEPWADSLGNKVFKVMLSSRRLSGSLLIKSFKGTQAMTVFR